MCVEFLPLDDVYGLGRAVADASRPKFLSDSQLELQFGPVADELCDSADLIAATADLRRRIEEDTGVLLPWVYAVPAAELAERQVKVRIYFRGVGGMVLPDDDRAAWVPAVVAELETRLRDYLYRLVGVDDVALWLKGWEPESGDGPAWDPPDPRADRLRLARVLRMLLREGVSVGDRGVIVPAVRDPGGVDTRSESATLATLRRVRESLGPAGLRVEPGTVVVPLPAVLQSRAAAGLLDGGPVWELPRAVACRLVADLRAWLADQPERPAAVTVADALVRPFVWRLLASERPAVRVLSESELS
jgi:flagellar biosynthesis component FlhA